MRKKRNRRRLYGALIACLVLPISLFAIDASDRYRSPRNPERKIRRSTELIVLHTTEAPSTSSLNKLSDRGEAHYCVTPEGTVYRIVDRDKEAFHAGRSMWRGKEDVDKFSIGIECVGYHNKPMGTVQLVAIRQLVKELKAMYDLSDDRVVCHCHVAYGAPNKWHRKKHRGRKRCAMLFATPTVRRILGLKSRPAFDPDQRAGRLVQGDSYLQGVLYGRTDPMAGKIGRVPQQSSPAPKSWIRSVFSKKSKPPEPPPKPRLVAASGPKGVASPPRPKAVASTPPKRQGRSAPVQNPLKKTPRDVAALRAGGWKFVGTVAKGVSASKLVGSKWNSPDTYYVVRGKLTSGDKIDPAKIQVGTGVWTR